MTKTLTVSLAALTLAAFALAGCHKSDCSTAIDGYLDRSIAAGKANLDLPAEALQMADEMKDRLDEPLTRLCLEDRWPATVIQCVENEQAGTDGKCDAMLSPAQKTHLDKVMAETMGMNRPQTAPTTGSAGSAAGAPKPAEPIGSSSMAPAPGGASASGSASSSLPSLVR